MTVLEGLPLGGRGTSLQLLLGPAPPHFFPISRLTHRDSTRALAPWECRRERPSLGSGLPARVLHGEALGSCIDASLGRAGPRTARAPRLQPPLRLSCGMALAAKLPSFPPSLPTYAAARGLPATLPAPPETFFLNQVWT